MLDITKKEFEEFCKAKELSKTEVNTRLKLLTELESKGVNYKYGLSIVIKPKCDEIKSDITKGLGKITSNSKEIKISETSAQAKEANDSYALLHQTLTTQSFEITIPKGKTINEPIVIKEEIIKSPFFLNLIINAEESSSATIVIEKEDKTNEKKSYLSERIVANAKKNSKITIITNQNEKELFNYQEKIGNAEKDSTLDFQEMILSSKYVRMNTQSNLLGEGSSSSNTVLYLGSKDQKYDLFTMANHEGKNTVSKIETSGALLESSKALSRGLIKINENASGSDGYESQKALLLSKKAEADAIPNLEINNSEVKCSHSSSVGPVDEDQLFYLMSRGLTKKDSQKEIIEGYFKPITKVMGENVQEEVSLAIKEALI